MSYPMDAQTCTRIRSMDWEREVAAMQLQQSASDTPQVRTAAGIAMGRLLVDVFTSLRHSIAHRQPRAV